MKMQKTDPEGSASCSPRRLPVVLGASRSFALALAMALVLCVGAGSAAFAAVGPTGSDVNRMIDDASYTGATAPTGSDVNRMIDDASYTGANAPTVFEPIAHPASVGSTPRQVVWLFVVVIAILTALLGASFAAKAIRSGSRLRRA